MENDEKMEDDHTRNKRMKHLHLQELRAVVADTKSLSNDLGGVDQIVEDTLINGGDGSAVRTVTSSRGRLSDDLSLGDDDDVLARELLL